VINIRFITIKNGVVNYDYIVDDGTAGKYTINLIIRDSYGNEETFNNIGSFTVLDQLFVFVETNEDSYFPGAIMNVFGQVKTELQDFIGAATIEVTMDGVTQSTSISDSQYTLDITIPEDIISGQHVVKVTVKDSNGNTGSGTVYIEVLPQPTKITVALEDVGGEIEPEDEIKIISYLYDQADEKIEENIILEVYDAEEERISQKSVATGEEAIFQVPQYAKPGTWTIKAYYADENGEIIVSDEDTIEIATVQELDYYIEDEVLYITNIGNVKYTEDVEIEVDGVDRDFLLTKTRNLGVGETIEIKPIKGQSSYLIPEGTKPKTNHLIRTGQNIIGVERGSTTINCKRCETKTGNSSGSEKKCWKASFDLPNIIIFGTSRY